MLDYYPIAVIALLAAISPGPDFVVVAKNAITHNRCKAVLTSLGVGAGILIHSSYCILGLGFIISQSLLLFSIIKYLGAGYLVYLGIKSLLNREKSLNPKIVNEKTSISSWKAFRDGFLTNLLNPKCTLFMLSIFTLVVKPHTSIAVQSMYGIEIALITTGWFVFLSLGLTHGVIKKKIEKLQHIVSKVIGVVLITFGIAIAFEAKS